MTYKSKGLTRETPEVFLEVSQELADEYKLRDGTLVRLQSPYGKVEVRTVVTDRVYGKEVYLPMNDSGDAALTYFQVQLPIKTRQHQLTKKRKRN